jgi:hypothetical protein
VHRDNHGDRGGGRGEAVARAGIRRRAGRQKGQAQRDVSDHPRELDLPPRPPATVKSDRGGQRQRRECEGPDQLDDVRIAVVSDAVDERQAEEEHDGADGAKDAGDIRAGGAVGAREQPAEIGLLDPSRFEPGANVVQKRNVLHTRYI